MMFLLHFVLIRRKYFILDSNNFLVDTDQNATFLLTGLRLMQFSYTKIGNFPDDFISFNKMHNFDTVLFGNFHDDFMFLTKWHHFHTKMGKFPDDFMAWTRYAIFIRWIFCIFWVPYERVPPQKKNGL